MSKLARSGKAPGQRQLKAGEVIRHALVEALREGHNHDEGLANVSITVTEVRVSPDLRHAVAFVMPLLGRDQDNVLKALKRTRGLYRGLISRRLTMKFVPEIDFELDTSFDQGLAIDGLLRSERVKRDLSGE